MTDSSLPIRSVEGLTRCPRCRRHIVAAETPQRSTCPFCARSNQVVRAAKGVAIASSIFALGCTSAAEAPPPEEAPAEIAQPRPEATPEVPETPETPEVPETPETPETPEAAPDEFRPEPAEPMRPQPRYGRPMTRPKTPKR